MSGDADGEASESQARGTNLGDGILPPAMSAGVVPLSPDSLNLVPLLPVPLLPPSPSKLSARALG